ncbi:MAG: NAD(P)/FAD-dependent oxidoreductase [Thaumarchaeota archaeon]|jgi:digeranylgeranylglycerophospholipid reductase|nr:NAD(P)/FAD-dependent oxidoreductase [Candidatus Geocrenenecus arthurdayi]
MMKRYDVIVVGGGPAGVSAAKAAGRTGAKTLLLEKAPTIMANKPCGQAVSQETLQTAEVKPEPSIVLHRAYALVYAPNLNYVKIDRIGFLIDKSRLLQYMAAQAAEYGAEIHVREEVQDVKIEDEVAKVKTNRGEYEASILIGADGYNSTVARSLGITEKSEPIPTVQYLMVNCNIKYPDAVRFYLGNKIAPGGYAWIFPHNEKIAEVGIGVRGAPSKEYLDAFVKRFDDELGKAQIIDYRGAPVPIGGLISEPIRDRVMLIGDAAGTVIPLTGAGIHSSIAAGLAAGRVAGEAAQEGNSSRERLSEFYILYKPWIDRIKKSLKVMRALEKMSDDELNLLAEILSDQDILDLANGLDILRVAKKLATHPIFAVKLVKAIT